MQRSNVRTITSPDECWECPTLATDVPQEAIVRIETTAGDKYCYDLRDQDTRDSVREGFEYKGQLANLIQEAEQEVERVYPALRKRRRTEPSKEAKQQEVKRLPVRRVVLPGTCFRCPTEEKVTADRILRIVTPTPESRQYCFDLSDPGQWSLIRDGFALSTAQREMLNRILCTDLALRYERVRLALSSEACARGPMSLPPSAQSQSQSSSSQQLPQPKSLALGASSRKRKAEEQPEPPQPRAPPRRPSENLFLEGYIGPNDEYHPLEYPEYAEFHLYNAQPCPSDPKSKVPVDPIMQESLEDAKAVLRVRAPKLTPVAQLAGMQSQNLEYNLGCENLEHLYTWLRERNSDPVSDLPFTQQQLNEITSLYRRLYNKTPAQAPALQATKSLRFEPMGLSPETIARAEHEMEEQANAAAVQRTYEEDLLREQEREWEEQLNRQAINEAMGQ